MISTQDKRSKTKLFIRPIPCVDFDWKYLKFDINQKVIYLRNLFESHSSFNQPSPPKFWRFPTSGIFFNSCQEEVYKIATDGLIEQIYRGYNNVIISYGQNYSGKSFTLSGLFNTFQLRGITPRFLVDLFEEQYVQLDKFAFSIWISITDVHGSVIFDLISNPKKKCETYKNITSVQISSATEGLKLLFKAEMQRMTVGNVSYNSHVASNIVTFTVEVKPLHAHDPVNKISKIHFLDLAGVETIERNPLTSFKERKNQGQANVAKTLFEIYALRSNKFKTSEYNECSVNQRIHNITQYLGNSLTHSSNIRLICHIRPNMFDLNLTLSLLKFGKNFQNIRTGSPEPHLEKNVEKTLENLQEKVTTLQDKLLMQKLWGERQPIIVSQNRIDFVKRAVKSFLKGDLTEYELISMVDDYSLILSITRNIHKDLKIGIHFDYASQTDNEVYRLPDIKKDYIESSEISSAVLRQSLTDNDKRASPTSLKKVSFGKSRKESKKGSKKSSGVKTLKNKGGKQSKEQEKLVLESAEVQVNLVEPFAKLPEIDSREGLWARFLIITPDAQVTLDQFNAAVREKGKLLNIEQIRYDDLIHNINKLKLNLEQLKSSRHIQGKETYDIDGKLVICDIESKLVKNLHQTQKQIEISKQKLTDAQLDWLESLEKLDEEKKQIENDFKQFCLSNDLLELDTQTSNNTQDIKNTNNKENIKSEENDTIEMPQNGSTGFREVFEFCQSKYLKKVMKSL